MAGPVHPGAGDCSIPGEAGGMAGSADVAGVAVSKGGVQRGWEPGNRLWVPTLPAPSSTI